MTSGLLTHTHKQLILTCRHTLTYMFTLTHFCAHIFTYTHSHKHIHVHPHSHSMCSCSHTHARAHTHVHNHTNTHTVTHTLTTHIPIHSHRPGLHTVSHTHTPVRSVSIPGVPFIASSVPDGTDTLTSRHGGRWHLLGSGFLTVLSSLPVPGEVDDFPISAVLLRPGVAHCVCLGTGLPK